MKNEPTGYWTFFCNPSKWEIDKFLLSGRKIDNYMVTPWQEEWFRPGQLGVVRVGVDARSKEQLEGRRKLQSGIYAIVQVLSHAKDPDESAYEEDSNLYWVGASVRGKRKVVDLRYVRNLIEQPLLISEMRKSRLFADKYLIDGMQAASMPLQPSVYDAIIDRVGAPEDVKWDFDENVVKTPGQLKQLENKYKDAAPQVREVISKQIERGPLAQQAKKQNQYKCMICEQLGQNPIGFIKKDGIPYIEAHHVIPVSNLQTGSLDLPNIMTLCANHHRECHYGSVEFLQGREEIFIVQIHGKILEIPKLKL
jgi:hypothetical protein